MKFLLKNSTDTTIFRGEIMSNHVYRNIESKQGIRLLFLEPGVTPTPIRYSLFEEELNEGCAEYEALSYTWGSSDDAREVACDSGALEVTANLHAALERFRLSDETRVLWIDAICINQKDSEEKTQQVLKIPDIFSHAKRVLVWLGQGWGPDSTGDAFRLLQHLSRVFHEYSDYLGLGSDDGRNVRASDIMLKRQSAWHAARREIIAKVNPDNISRACWGALGTLLRQAWFTRVWVVPEAFLARNQEPDPTLVVCGPHEIPWDTLITPIIGLRVLSLDYYLWLWKDERNPAPLRPFAGGVNMLRSVERFIFLERTNSKVDRLHALLKMSKTMDATDPRDKIFALFSLLPKDDAAAKDPSMAPDYSKDVVQVYKDVAKHFLFKRHTVPLLEMVRDGDLPGRIPQLPSWVADWSAPLSGNVFQDCHFSAGIPPHGAEIHRDGVVIDLSGDGNTLRMMGKIVQTVATILRAETELTPAMVLGSSGGDTGTSQWTNHEAAFSKFRAHLCYKNYLCQARKLDPNATDEQQGLTCFDAPSSTALYPTGETLYEAFWRTMLCNMTEGLTKPPAEYGTFFESYNKFEAAYCANGHRNSHDMLRERRWVQQTEIFSMARHRFAPGRRFCITGAGYMGWVTQRVQNGDVLAILEGADLVYALRRHQNTDHAYELLGGCYLHGFMDGEGLADDSIKLQEIYLR